MFITYGRKMEKRILLTECNDDIGLIAKITNCCFDHHLNVIRQDQFASSTDSKFFMRSVLEGDFFYADRFLEDVKSVLPDGAHVRLADNHRRRLCILVTKESHCLGEILMKTYAGAFYLSFS